ncbi:probable Vacuolar membrane-associated protein IML1 [Melanopsichium pennsylvanicum]|uniref:Vacuolar membrane-associated protein IML1 n=2 Tax=Melanopsichium pennsylvanicum TaxID=63383 RepID=A0AAJ4XJ28_9BASI|nr:vacuolar membrane-associated protein [Melanopsichium pennsylvanicum 4]SNX83284.1 probable Vacuolar membrane-associated protein IML1 [Melanopsichium pennsylvanicum]
MLAQYPSGSRATSLSVDRFSSASDRRHSSSSSTRQQRPQINERPITLWTHDPPNFSRNEVVLNPEFSLPRLTERDLLQLTLPAGSRLPHNNIKFGPKDRIRKFSTKATFVFRAAQATADADFIARQPQLQISVSKNIANNYGFYNRAEAVLSRVSKQDHTIDHVELYFRDQYVGRAEMWRVFQNLEDTCVYCGQKVTLAGSVRATIGRIFIKEKKVTSGYVSVSTKAIFRSESAKYNLFIQLAREMWEFDEDGEIYYEKALQGFIPELLKRWKAVPTNHILTVILFARVHYDESELHMIEGPIRQDWRGRYYIDYYKVVVDLESNCNWDPVMTTLKEEFFRFQHDILLLRRPISGPAASHEELHAELIRDRVHMAGRLSYSYEGNLLEAINLALNPFDEHYIDRDLNRTGLSMVFVTAGTGHFDVDKKLLRVTTERMIENGTGLDLVCLTKMPLHSVPLFHFTSHYPDPSELKQSQAAGNRSQRRPASGTGPGMTVHRPGRPALLSRHSSSRLAAASAAIANPPDPLYFDSKKPPEEEEDFYSMPHWIDCSFYNLQQDKPFRADRFVPRCKMYEVQMMGIMENQISDIAIPYLDLKPVNKAPSVQSSFYLPRYNQASGSGFLSEPPNSELSDLALVGLSPKQQRRIARERFDHDVFRDVPPHVKPPAVKLERSGGGASFESPATSEVHRPLDRPGLRRNPSSGYGNAPNTNTNSAASSVSPSKVGMARLAGLPTRASRLGREASFRKEEPVTDASAPPSPTKPRLTVLEETLNRPPLARPVSQIVTSTTSKPNSRAGSIRSVNTFSRGLLPMEPIGKAKALVASTDAVLSATSHAFDEDAHEEVASKRNKADDGVSSLRSPAQSRPKGYGWLWKTLTGSTPSRARSAARSGDSEDDQGARDLSTPATRSMQEVLSAQLRQQAGGADKGKSAMRKPQTPDRLTRTTSLLSVHEASSPTPIKIPAQATPRTRQEQEAEEKILRDQEAYEQQLEEEEARQRYAQRAQVEKQTLVNPSNPSKNLKNSTSQLLRWQHLFPRRLNHHAVKWRSMTTPACLPLTTLYLPTESDLAAMWSEHPHTTSISAETASFLLKKSSSTHPALAVLQEMAYHRLAQGYQFIVPASKQTRAVSSRKLVDPKHFTLRWPSELLQPGNLATGNPIFLSVTNQIHRISYDRSTSAINVKRYVRNTDYSTDPIDYECCIWPRHLPGYQTVKARFSYPDSASHNWTYLDSLIAGYVDEKFVESLRYWRTRFVLVPSEGSPPPMKAPTGEDLDDEEIRLIGTDKLAELFHRARFVRSKEERDQSHVQRFLPTSLDPAMSLQDNDFMKQLAEENARQRAQSASSKKRLHKTMSGRPLDAVAKDMRSGGLVINDRIWHRMLYSDTFTGADMVTWMCGEYTDVRSREDAVELGMRLMEEGLFEHVHKVHGFLDGHYFYRLKSEYAGARGPKGWFRGSDSQRGSFAEKETPVRPLVHSSSHHSGLNGAGEFATEKNPAASASFRASAGGHSRSSSLHHPHPPSLTMSSTAKTQKKKKVQLSRSIIIDVDPGRRSDRAEVAFLHHDIAHNPANGFNFQVHWLSTSARFIEDTVQSWTRTLDRYGLRLIEAPIGQIKDVSAHNPFQAPVQIELALPPPSPDMYKDRLPRGTLGELWFEYALLRKFGFVLDQEASGRYPRDVEITYSSRPNEFEFSQFVHRSGVAFVQVLGGLDGFLWLNNRLFNSHAHAGNGPGRGQPHSGRQLPHQSQQGQGHIQGQAQAQNQAQAQEAAADADKLRLELTRFCSNKDELERFYRKVLAQLLQVEKEENKREQLAKEYVQSMFTHQQSQLQQQQQEGQGQGGEPNPDRNGKSRQGSHHSTAREGMF